MGKYDPLHRFLEARAKDAVPMTFSEIEKVIGSSLPASAYNHRAWWSNNPSNSVMTYSWLEAGYRSEMVDMEKQTVVFRKADKSGPGPSGKMATESLQKEGSVTNVTLAQIIGCMKGTIRISAECDCAAPSGEQWHADEGRL